MLMENKLCALGQLAIEICNRRFACANFLKRKLPYKLDLLLDVDHVVVDVVETLLFRAQP